MAIEARERLCVQPASRTFAKRPIGLEEVGLEIHIEQVARHALDRVVEGQDVDLLAVWYVLLGVDGDDIAQAHAEVLSHNLATQKKSSLGQRKDSYKNRRSSRYCCLCYCLLLSAECVTACKLHACLYLRRRDMHGGRGYLVDSNVGVLGIVVRKHDANCVSPLLALEQDGVSSKQLQLLHLLGRQANHTVVVIHGIVHHELVRRLPLVHYARVYRGRVRHF